MTLGSLKPLHSDSILGLMTAFQADPAPGKIDLTVGVYRDNEGKTPVMQAVSTAEHQLLDEQQTKAYIPPMGVPGYRSQMAKLVLGDALSERLAQRTVVLQTPGGCGALRVAAELYGRAQPGNKVYLSEPTWGNHHGLMGGANLPIGRYPYYDVESHGVMSNHLLEAIDALPPQSLVLLQASCHNPTGANPDAATWESVIDLLERRDLLPLFDLAYQGLGDGLNVDAAAVRMAAERLPEVLVAVSNSKNFGLYRERTGALIAVGSEAASVATLESQVKNITRGMYSMSPAHGGLIVERILCDPALRKAWQTELEVMRTRLNNLRIEFSEALGTLRPDIDSSWLTRQRGMFSLLGLSAKQVDRLREQHIYMVWDSRINVAGLSISNIPRVAEAIAPLLALA